MAKLFNRAKMDTSTTGSGTITLGSAVDGYQTFADAGVADSDVVQYVIEDGTSWEIGTGTYSATGTSLTRTPSESSNAGAAISLTGAAEVFITAVADDLNRLQNAGSDIVTVSASGAAVTGNITVTGTVDGRDIASDGSKLDGIEASADVTDTANVTAAGALMDSEVTNLAQVKAFDSADYATAAQGSLADSAIQAADLATVATTGAYSDLTGTPAPYADADVDTHLNTGTATTDQFLSWTGSDYDWVDVGGGFPAGTLMLFQQTSAPTGWTKQTTHNNKALRVVSGTAGSGGSAAFTTAFGTPSVSGSVSLSGSVGSTTLSTAQMPSHKHLSTIGYVGTYGGAYGGGGFYGGGGSSTKDYTANTGGGGSHTHSFSGSGSLSSATASINVQYVDLIIARKD